MEPAGTRSKRLAVLLLVATLALLGLELWGIRAALTAITIVSR